MTKASIKGFELRSVREFKGHEQEDLFQGNIYYQGKRVGWYSDDAWGKDHINNIKRYGLVGGLVQNTKNDISNGVKAKKFRNQSNNKSSTDNSSDGKASK